MIAHWMLYATAVALLLGGAALAVEWVARVYGLAGRWAWVSSIAGSLLLPVFALLRIHAVPAAGSGGTVGLLQGAASVTGGGPSAPSTVSALLAVLHSVAAHAVAMLGVVRAAAARVDITLSPLTPTLVVLWALLSAGLVAYLGMSAWLLRGVLKRSRPERVDGHDVLVSEGTGPGVVGVWRQRIVVPAWVLEEADAARRMILAHEREHMAAGDPRLLAYSFLALVLMPWNLALWWQTRRLRLALELDCDARVLRDARDRHSYGSLLLYVVERGGRETFAAAFAEPPSLLERRIRALSASPPRARGRRAIPALTGTALLVAAACAAPHPSSVGSTSTAEDGARVATKGAAPELGPTIAELRSAASARARRQQMIDSANVFYRQEGVPEEGKVPTLLNPKEVQAEVNAALDSIPPSSDSARVFAVMLAVDTAGEVFAAKVTWSSGEPRLDDALKAAYERGRFTITRDATGRAVLGRIGMTIPTDR